MLGGFFQTSAKTYHIAKQCHKNNILNLNSIGPYFGDIRDPHLTQNESKVLSDSHVSDVPD